MAEGYFGLRDTHIGIDFPGLDHTVGKWASEGLLVIFFFLVGLEPKTEFVHGELRNIRKAMLPVAMRTFLLTLAVVDELITIMIIAFVCTDDLGVLQPLLALVPLGLFTLLAQTFPGFSMEHHWAAWIILLPIGIVTWLFVLEAGIHATIAGVLLGVAVPVKKATPRVIRQEEPELGLAPALEHRFRPLSNGLAMVAGIGFAVSLLVAELSFGLGSAHGEHAKAGILTGSAIAAVLGGTLLAVRNAHYRKLRLAGAAVDKLDAAEAGRPFRPCRRSAVRRHRGEDRRARRPVRPGAAAADLETFVH
ncbi:Na+/H+ antiporter NhaA [Kocuria sabuli]|uniref:Na+/H+ antiporter NhaA n=1 Tax=Kocuria sabuli TaxID=3071448 RepID=UPI0034D3DB04